MPTSAEAGKSHPAGDGRWCERQRAIARSTRGKIGKERCEVFYPAPKLCTDNGAMIAYAGALRLAAGEV